MKTLWPRKVKNLTQDHMTGGWGAGIGAGRLALHPDSKTPSHTASSTKLLCVWLLPADETYPVNRICPELLPIQATYLELHIAMPLFILFLRLGGSLHSPLFTCHLLFLANIYSLLKIQFRGCSPHPENSWMPPSPFHCPLSHSTKAHLHHSINYKMENPSVCLSVSPSKL